MTSAFATRFLRMPSCSSEIAIAVDNRYMLYVHFFNIYSLSLVLELSKGLCILFKEFLFLGRKETKVSTATDMNYAIVFMVSNGHKGLRIRFLR